MFVSFPFIHDEGGKSNNRNVVGFRSWGMENVQSLWPYTAIRILKRQVGFEVISEQNSEGKGPRDKDKRGLPNGEVRSSVTSTLRYKLEIFKRGR